MCIGGVAVSMKLDTGASVSLVSEKHSVFSGQLVGSVIVSVSYKSQQAQLPLLVVTGEGPSLFGRDW